MRRAGPPPLRLAVLAGTALALVGSAHTAVNLRHLRRAPHPPATHPAHQRHVVVGVPARDEAHRIGPCIAALLAQDHPHLRVLVLDDGSTDGTGALVRAAVGTDPRFTVLDGGAEPPPASWLGKPWACHRLARAALAEAQVDLLVLLDADVVLAPDAITRIAALVDDAGLDLASPYPRQLAITPAERLVQPLLQWSWCTTLPLRLAERSPRPSLTAANGQVLAITPAAYQRSGGHAAVRGGVLEDLALARAVKASGGRVAVTDGTDLATCRMYDGAAALVEGYTKSLWRAFGSPLGAAGATAALTLVYVLPPAAALASRDRRTCTIGAVGYAAAVAGRVLVARRTGARIADAFAHPGSIMALDALAALSVHRRRRGQLAWKGRAIP
jgi:hypothetical protein